MKTENNIYGNAAAVFRPREVAKTICKTASSGMVGVNIGFPSLENHIVLGLE